jgi:hypothetical protein
MACDNTSPDNGLTPADQCISIAHGPAAFWWLSPAITLNGVSAGAVANANPSNNVVDVTFHRAGASCVLPEGTGNVLVSVYVCLPGMAMNPSDLTQVKPLATQAVPLSQATAGADTSLSSVSKQINWVAGTDATKPDGPGHKCLVAVAYPDSLTADPACFHQAGATADQHYAQLNVGIQPVDQRHQRQMSFHTFTVNPSRDTVSPATLRVELDPDPDPGVLAVLNPALTATPGFKRLAGQPPRNFRLQMPTFPNAVVRDDTRWGCLGLVFWILGLFGYGTKFRPTYEADVQLQPSQVAVVNFEADLSGALSGDAYIFHLTHVRGDGRVIGGLTLVGVVQ